MEAFQSKDPNGSGYISALDFQEIMVAVKRHLLTEDVKDNLVAVSFLFFILKNSPKDLNVQCNTFLGNRRPQS